MISDESIFLTFSSCLLLSHFAMVQIDIRWNTNDYNWSAPVLQQKIFLNVIMSPFPWSHHSNDFGYGQETRGIITRWNGPS